MAEFIKTQITDHIAYVGLDRGKSNAMHLEMLQELHAELLQHRNDPAVEALVLHGKEGFFSSGLDLITLYGYDEQTMLRFWEAFMDVIYDLSAFPKPVIASVTGHSPAGGCVLALCCDYRIMAEGDYVIGLNEVPVGIVVPHSIFALYSFWIGQPNAYRNLLEGKLLSPAEALNIGLVDELTAANRIQTLAARKAKSWTQFDRSAWGETKINLRQELLRKIKENKTEAIQQVLEQWWRPSTRHILKTIIDNLTKNRG
jgi:Delta3-Delta2-enoyl-CoA isomerase